MASNHLFNIVLQITKNAGIMSPGSRLFAGKIFMTRTLRDNMESNSTNYVDEWIRIFHDVLGWTPYRTLQWIDHNDLERGLEDVGEAPLYWAIPEFIPIKLRRQLDVKQILSMQHDIWRLYLRSNSYRKHSVGYKEFRDDLNRYLKRKYQVELDVPANVSA